MSRRDLVEILDPGLLATVQDLGRHGLGALGIARAGAADTLALRISNELLGNDPGAAAIEITGGPLRLRVLRSCTVAVAGGRAGPAGHHDPAGTAGRTGDARAVSLESGTVVDVVATPGLRACLALPGGIDVPQVLGSRATDVAAGFGGLDGRPLRAGDRLAVGDRYSDDVIRLVTRWPTPLPDRLGPIHVVAGPHADALGPVACGALTRTTWRVGTTSDRMGLRLDGDPLTGSMPAEVPSLGVMPGTIQVPPDGRPIILLPDAQPTGGYPVIGVVAAADRPVLGQLRPGDPIRFTWVDQARAAALRHAAATEIAGARAHLRESAAWDDLWRNAGG